MSCLLQNAGGGKGVPRPLLHTETPSGPNDIVAFDYMFIRKATADTDSGFTYVLVLKDLFSRFVELIPSASADAEHVVRALLDWYRRYGPACTWISDRGSHFVNDIVGKLADLHSTGHHLTVAYAPWSNGAVERANREIREVLSGLVLEARHGHDEWPLMLPLVQHSLNNIPSPALDGLAPITVFLGKEPLPPLAALYDSRLLSLVYPPAGKSVSVRAHTESLRAALHECENRVAAARKRSHLSRAGKVEVDFGVGDYVFTAIVGSPPKEKVHPLWEGPAAVLEARNDRVFRVQDVGNDRVQLLHAQHLKLFADSSLILTPQLREFAAHGGRGFVIDHISSHHWTADGQPFGYAHWEGCLEEAPTEESLARLFTEVPVVVRRYLKTVTSTGEREHLTAAVSAAAH